MTNRRIDHCLYCSAYFHRMCWTEDAVERAVLIPPLVGIVNCTVWLVYGCMIDEKNMSVIVVNATGAICNVGYAAIYLLHFGNPCGQTCARIGLAAVIAVTIAVIAL